jgi:hypothetical protein
MKRTDRPAQLDATQSQSSADATAALNRLTLTLMDQFTCEKQGYDPYDTRARKPDIWRSKRKRA